MIKLKKCKKCKDKKELTKVDKRQIDRQIDIKLEEGAKGLQVTEQLDAYARLYSDVVK